MIYSKELNNGTNIFVFGSNLAGRHGKGAAKTAADFWGAKYGVGVGRTGNSYAIPTKDAYLSSLPMEKIRHFVSRFLCYASSNLHLCFLVTRIGCGLAGYKDEDIAPFFLGAPRNCVLPIEWSDILSQLKT